MRAQSHGNENDYEPTSLKNIIKTKNNIYASLILFEGAHQESISQPDLLLKATFSQTKAECGDQCKVLLLAMDN